MQEDRIMKMKHKSLLQQNKIQWGRYAVVTLLSVILINGLALIHAGFSAANLLLLVVFCVTYFKYAVPNKFRKTISGLYLVCLIVCSLPSVLLTFLLAVSFALCFAGRLDWNELAATF